ncbi:uncharacterized serine/threonine-protein kinase SBK3 [Rhinichthys klamathensis goyatoka]|uniref:uncharacterized serine/threonine-protein kinase SBK3 n=1 Tax=Rhinichthys klamathensis goyatoka TaxID=3034132 RepID=UPI0024B595BA|nr:uncharacterized serine/threonine-protein kinase SBK3 [Rhinichthys klamathensis goyatoka]
MTTAPRKLDELCYLTAQSMTSLVTSEHFKLIKKLGEGSYGKVMLAVHQKRGTPMALKFFPRRSTTLQAFLREYNLSVSYCTHPSLTRAIGIFYSTPSHYVFAQEAGLYGDLYDVIVSEVVSEECAQSVMSQLSGAVSHLHSLGFVHRDIKPENIFLCDRLCRWVKLGDFGLARAKGTKVRAVWYNSPFCVPEMECAKTVSEGKEGAEDTWMTVEPSLDTWSLGILIYCLLTSCFPWEETTSDDPSYCKYRDWFNRTKEREERARGPNELREGNHCEKQNTVREENEAELEVARQFDSLSSFVLILLRKLLNPLPWLRPGPEEILSYLGGPWLLKTEKEELRREQEAHLEAKKIHERGGVEGGKEILGRRER